jgi:hypothetical protein
MRQFAKRMLLVVAFLFLLGGYTAAFFRFRQDRYAIGEAACFTGVLVLMTVAVFIGWFQDRKPPEAVTNRSQEKRFRILDKETGRSVVNLNQPARRLLFIWGASFARWAAGTMVAKD